MNIFNKLSNMLKVRKLNWVNLITDHTPIVTFTPMRRGHAISLQFCQSGNSPRIYKQPNKNLEIDPNDFITT